MEKIPNEGKRIHLLFWVRYKSCLVKIFVSKFNGIKPWLREKSTTHIYSPSSLKVIFKDIKLQFRIDLNQILIDFDLSLSQTMYESHISLSHKFKKLLSKSAKKLIFNPHQIGVKSFRDNNNGHTRWVDYKIFQILWIIKITWYELMISSITIFVKIIILKLVCYISRLYFLFFPFCISIHL